MVRVKVASPCPMLWDRLERTEAQGVRFCHECSKNVYNIIEMSEADLNTLLADAKTGASVCMRLYQRADGTVVTGDCPVGLKKVRQFWQRMKAGAAASLAILFSSTPVVLGQNKDNSLKNASNPSNKSFKLTGSVSQNNSSLESAYTVKRQYKLVGSSQNDRNVSSIMGGVSKPPTLEEIRTQMRSTSSPVNSQFDYQTSSQSTPVYTTWASRAKNEAGEKALLVRLRMKQAKQVEAQGDQNTARAVLDQAQIEADRLENRYDLQQEVLQARLALAQKMGKSWLGPVPVSSPVKAKRF